MHRMIGDIVSPCCDKMLPVTVRARAGERNCSYGVCIKHTTQILCYALPNLVRRLFFLHLVYYTSLYLYCLYVLDRNG